MKSLFWSSLFLICFSCGQKSDHMEVISYFMDNYSYDWNRISVSTIDPNFLIRCESYCDEALEHGCYDGMKLKRVYEENYLDSTYRILEFEFDDVTDYRLCLIVKKSSEQIIGYFTRSLA